jgi:hypothetical protein
MRSPLEIVATHAVIALQVANDGFDGGGRVYGHHMGYRAAPWRAARTAPLGAVTGRGN